ncbi:Hcp family type VI secretion system effector [Luteibacter sp.]|jgi:type VI secretion system secreted protein Hcp|uniref:Hcp family type VI secretion system effector n=1 Tax=Luteibacter sp. TaxID=1886636 RepID=UPI002F40FFA7
MKSIYLKLSGPDMKGESMDKEHSQWIELSALHHEIMQPASRNASTAGGHAMGRTEHGDMTVVKDLDMASPLLAQAVSSGITFDAAQIVFYRAAGDGKRVKYLEIQLKNVLISRLELSVNDVLLPVESISLRYAAIQWKYQKQKIDGGVAGNTLGTWSLTKNDKTFSV